MWSSPSTCRQLSVCSACMTVFSMLHSVLFWLGLDLRSIYTWHSCLVPCPSAIVLLHIPHWHKPNVHDAAFDEKRSCLTWWRRSWLFFHCCFFTLWSHSVCWDTLPSHMSNWFINYAIVSKSCCMLFAEATAFKWGICSFIHLVRARLLIDPDIPQWIEVHVLVFEFRFDTVSDACNVYHWCVQRTRAKAVIPVKQTGF